VPALVGHSFPLPSPLPTGCTEAVVRATLLYRPLPLGLSRERGWDGRDYVVQSKEEVVGL
jgi:hypothetical protein